MHDINYIRNYPEEFDNSLKLRFLDPVSNKILTLDKSRKAIITDYQFIAPVLKIYDFSPNQWHHPSISFPTKDQKYFYKYKKFFIKSLKQNNIDIIYETSKTNDSIIELVINSDCFSKERVTKMLIKFELKKDCKEFK